MTFEDFVAGFSPDSAPNWEVTPTSGTLQRRGGEPQVTACPPRCRAAMTEPRPLGTLQGSLDRGGGH
jgi:hypothetical protein